MNRSFICHNCKHEISPGSVRCSHCGLSCRSMHAGSTSTQVEHFSPHLHVLIAVTVYLVLMSIFADMVGYGLIESIAMSFVIAILYGYVLRPLLRHTAVVVLIVGLVTILAWNVVGQQFSLGIALVGFICGGVPAYIMATM